MKKQITTLLALAMTVPCLMAQNVITHDAVGQSPLTFVQENLAGGGVFIYNVKFANSSSSIKTANIGTFERNGADQLPFDTGILLTTGDIKVAEGPNNDDMANDPLATPYADPEMNGLATNTITSCATLDFDFVSLSSTVVFNYVFGSEEYLEYVCSAYNDVFAFLLTGIDPETGDETTRNIAMIPGSDTIWNGKYPNGIAVSVNSVNDGVAGKNGNGSNCFWDFSDYYLDNPYSSTAPLPGVQYNGLTNKLAAVGSIVPCQVYHMHISVCNVGDYEYDSGVFIEGQSFSSPNASIGLSIPGVQTVMGSCPKGVKLTLGNTDFESGTVYFSAKGNATLGEDFDIVDAQGNIIGIDGFTIDKTDRQFYIRAHEGIDLNEDRTFDLFLTTQLCAAFPQLNMQDTMHFRITKGDDVKLGDTVLTCSEACFQVTAPLIYGSEPISYRWEPTTGIDNPYQRTSTAMITSNSEYKLYATGGTGCNTDVATVKIVIEGSEWVGIDPTEAASVQVRATGDMLTLVGEQMQTVEIYSVDGRLLIERTLANASGEVQIGVASLEAGVYGVRVRTANGTMGTKVVLTK